MNDPEPLLAKKELFESFSQRTTYSLSSYSFSNVFLWKDFFNFDFHIIEDCLCVFAQNEIGCFLYLPPLSRNISSSVVNKCFDHMREINGNNGVSRIENLQEGSLEYFNRDDFRIFKKSSEYCYMRREIVELKGNKYKSKRSSYNQFVNNYKYEFVDYEPRMADECSELFLSWAQNKKEKHSDDIFINMIEENESVHNLAFKYFKELDLIGKVVIVDGGIKAYSLGHRLNDEFFCILFEITDLDTKGLPTFIFREFCGDKKVRPYKYINVMDDFGMDNIRQTKMSFYPAFKIPSFTIYERQ